MALDDQRQRRLRNIPPQLGNAVGWLSGCLLQANEPAIRADFRQTHSHEDWTRQQALV
jgi:hypothetical protein